jgi:4-hydroxybenzoate polyprenyltransferase
MFNRAYRLVNLLSLDVALGAMITALFFSKQLLAPVRAYGIAVLGLTVWVIYTTDRLMDVQHLKEPAFSERHRFHQKYSKPLWVAIAAAVLIVGVLIIFIRPSVIVGGLILAPIILIYLLLQKKLPIKEFTVAVLYTLGVLLPAWPESWQLIMSAAGLIAQLFLIALTNLLLFAWFECDADSKMGQASLATRFGKKTVSTLVIILFVGGISLSFVGMISNPISWIFLLMWFVLICLFIFHSFFEQYERYRLWGDAIFYLPLIGLI